LENYCCKHLIQVSSSLGLLKDYINYCLDGVTRKGAEEKIKQLKK
jgi:hypothetical protein